MKKVNKGDDGSNLARFRADPELIRVSIRRILDKDQWLVTIASRDDEENEEVFTCAATNPQFAINDVIQRAGEAKIPGIDFWMQKLYKHPQT